MASEQKQCSEWLEFETIQKEIQKEVKEQAELSKQLLSKQNKLKAKIKEQHKHWSRVLELTNDDPQIGAKMKEYRSELRTYDNQILNNGGFLIRAFLGSTNSVTMIGDEKRRYQFKEEYEQFKYRWTLLVIPFAIAQLFFLRNRVLDTLFQLLLTYFYLSLALRENVLRANGSNIQRWWIWHHYVSLLLTMTMTTWPATETYNYFRLPFYMYALYAGIVQILQYRYQRQRLYVLTSLGQANVMDVTNAESTQIMLERSFAVLLPFIFLGHAMQLFNSLTLFRAIHAGNVEWQVYMVAIFFLMLAVGNIQAMVLVIRGKYSKKHK